MCILESQLPLLISSCSKHLYKHSVYVCPSVRLSIRHTSQGSISRVFTQISWYFTENTHRVGENKIFSRSSAKFHGHTVQKLYWNGPNLGFPGIFFKKKTHGTAGLKFGMFVYPDHLLGLIRFCSWPVDFSQFGAILTQWNMSNLEFPGIFMRMNEKNDMEFGTLMNPDHLHSWLDFCHGLLIFLIFLHSYMQKI